MTSSIDTILSAWPLHQSNSIDQSFIHEDISSSNYCSTYKVTPRVSLQNNKHQSYIVKFLKRSADRDKVNYFNQGIHIQKALSDIGVTPEILYYCEKSSVCIMPYLENTPFENVNSIKQRKITLKYISQQLKNLHSYTTDELNTPWIPSSTHIKNYAKAITTQLNPAANKEFNTLISITTPYINAFDSDSTPKVLCHNDLNSGNILAQKNKVLFIDWEFAALNNPWFDIASLSYYLKLSSSEINKLSLECLGCTSTANNYKNALITVIILDILWNLYLSKKTNLSWKHLEAKKLELNAILNN